MSTCRRPHSDVPLTGRNCADPAFKIIDRVNSCTVTSQSGVSWQSRVLRTSGPGVFLAAGSGLTFTAVRTEAGICFRFAPVGSTEDLNNCYQMLLRRRGQVAAPCNKVLPALDSKLGEFWMFDDFCLLYKPKELKLASVRIGSLLCFSHMDERWLVSKTESSLIG